MIKFQPGLNFKGFKDDTQTDRQADSSIYLKPFIVTVIIPLLLPTVLSLIRKQPVTWDKYCVRQW